MSTRTSRARYAANRRWGEQARSYAYVGSAALEPVNLYRMDGQFSYPEDRPQPRIVPKPIPAQSWVGFILIGCRMLPYGSAYVH